jgi:hypothetical protein
MNDMISRSALIAELEAFKMSLGDIVLRFVVDRVIDLVKNFQVKETKPVEKVCETCKDLHTVFNMEPCRSCVTVRENPPSNWSPKR